MEKNLRDLNKKEPVYDLHDSVERIITTAYDNYIRYSLVLNKTREILDLNKKLLNNLKSSKAQYEESISLLQEYENSLDNKELIEKKMKEKDGIEKEIGGWKKIRRYSVSNRGFGKSGRERKRIIS